MAKNTYGISNDIYTNYNKGEVLLQVEDVENYLKGPQTKFIILKGKVKIFFEKPGAKYTPVKIQNSERPEDLDIDRIGPIVYGELEEFGDFRHLFSKNKFIKQFYCVGNALSLKFSF